MWYNLASNPQVIQAIYGPEEPSLKQVLLHELEFRLDGGSVILLRFRPANYPTNPPKKWVERSNNTTSISLQLIDVQKTTLEGHGIVPSTLCEFALERQGEQLLLKIEAANLRVAVQFKHLYIDNVVAYRGKL